MDFGIHLTDTLWSGGIIAGLTSRTVLKPIGPIAPNLAPS